MWSLTRPTYSAGQTFAICTSKVRDPELNSDSVPWTM